LSSAHREVRLPNSFAYFALFAWPFVCVALFVWLPVEAAAIWSLLAGYLLLPSATVFDLKPLPPFDKFSIPSIAVFLLCWMKGAQAPAPRRSIVIYLLSSMFIISPFLTSLTNSYEIQLTNHSLPGFYPMDGLKMCYRNIIEILPFFIGMRFVSTNSAQKLLIKSFAVACIFYSMPMLFEIRFSPQLHRLVYGFFPHEFYQQYRGGGFRPVVFLNHGLEVALFASLATTAALIAMRARWRLLRLSSGTVATYLGIILVLCKTMGAIIYALIAAPIVLFTRPRAWINVTVAILLVISAYPLLRTYDLIPVRRFAGAVSSVSADRSSSFAWRVKNEDLLLAKANQKPFLGWGGWARNRVFQEETGEDISVTDGEWIQRFGTWGWFGYLSLFGLFLSAALRARSVVSGGGGERDVLLAGLALLLAVNCLDLIPNANLRPMTYLLAGSVAGCVRVRSRQKSHSSVGESSSVTRVLAKSRGESLEPVV
jgi:hypothetical protein